MTYQFDQVEKTVTLSKGGEKNIDGNIYGMRQGSSRTIRTSYFDGRLWIDISVDEKGSDTDSSNLTIYIKG